MSEFKDDADPLDVLGPDVFRLIVAQLDTACLGKCSLVSVSWRDICDCPELWYPHCQALWQGKRYVAEDIKHDGDPKMAYVRSIRDCSRTTITTTELCSFAWTFKFKHQALDHSTTGTSNEMIRYFQHDGSYVIGENDSPFQHPQYRWQFLTQKGGHPGVCVQINRFPCLTISRTPDWGWRMENPWVLFTSKSHPYRPPTGPAKAARADSAASPPLSSRQVLLGH